MKILVIDDNLTAREAISNFLSDHHEIIMAKSLDEGINGLKENPDLVITDWNLGVNINSAEIVDMCIKEGVRVVIQTGSPYSDELDSSRKIGVEIIHKLDLRDQIKNNLERIGKSRLER